MTTMTSQMPLPVGPPAAVPVGLAAALVCDGDGGRGVLVNLPALREIGFKANRRLLSVQGLDHDPITGATALHTVTDPTITPTGTRVPGLRLGQQRSHALLTALPMFRLQPARFTNADLRGIIAGLRGLSADQVSTGQMT